MLAECRVVSGPDCFTLRLHDAPDIAVSPDGHGFDAIEAAARRDPDGTPVALRVDRTSLVLLGWVAVGAGQPVDAVELGARPDGLADLDLAVVPGWLVGRDPAVRCSGAVLDTQPCPGATPWLTSTMPSAATDRYGPTGIAVEVAPSLGSLDGPSVMAGPFLVARRFTFGGDQAPYWVVDRLDPSISVRVDPGDGGATRAVDPAVGPAAESDPVVGTGGVPGTAGPGVLDPAEVLAQTSPRLSRQDLATQVMDGSLHGRLVFVDGTLRSAPVRCQGIARGTVGCVDLRIVGLGLPVSAGDAAIHGPATRRPAPGW